MKLDWDEFKKQINFKKHGLDFEDAGLVFQGKTVTFEDNRQDYSEQRLITLGLLKGRCVVVVHTPRKGFTRIISMRKANEREKAIYQKRLEEN